MDSDPQGGATRLAMGCEASQAVANGLESSYEPGLLLPKVILHTPRKLYFQKCFNRFLCILSLPEHFKHLQMHIFLGKGTILFRPTPVFALHLCSIFTATSWWLYAFLTSCGGLWRRELLLVSQTSAHSDQPSACSGEIQSAQSKFEIAKYGKSAGRSEKAEEKKEANLEGPATSPQNRQTLQLGGKGVKQRCEKHCLRPRCWVLTSTAWVCSNLELTFWKVGRYLQTCTHYSTGAGLRPWRSSR